MRPLFIFIFSVLTLNGFSQDNYKNRITANNSTSFDRILSISPTISNGTISSLGSYNASFICNDYKGDSLWTIELPYWSRGIASFQQTDSSFILLSLLRDSLLIIIKTDPNGNPITTKYLTLQLGNTFFGSIFGYSRLSDTSLVIDINNIFYFINTDGFIYKKITVDILNATNYPSLWMHPDVVRSYIFEKNKIFISGTIWDTLPSGSGNEYKAFVICIDTSGNLLWDRIIYDQPNPVFINSIFKDSSENLLIGGRYQDYGPVIYQYTIIIKVDSNGNYLWAKQLNPHLAQEIRSISKGIRTDYAIMDDQGLLYETDSNGIILFKKTLQGNFIFPANTFVTSDNYLITSDISRLYKTDTLIHFNCGEDTLLNYPTVDYNLSDTMGIQYTFSTNNVVENFRDTTLIYNKGFQYENMCSSTNSIDYFRFTSINIFPNPTSGRITINLFQQSIFTNVFITNAFGQEISRATYSNTSRLELDIKGLSGLYFVRVVSGEKSIVYKVVKM